MRHAEAEDVVCDDGFWLRTFLEAPDGAIIDCRDVTWANCAGRNPLLGNIVDCCQSSD